MDKLGSVAILDAGAQYGKVGFFPDCFFVVAFFALTFYIFVKN